MSVRLARWLLVGSLLAVGCNGRNGKQMPETDKSGPAQTSGEQTPGKPKPSNDGAEAEYPNPGLLLEPNELAEPELMDQFVVLDVRPQAEYDQGHIPGARRVDLELWKEAFFNGEGAAGWHDAAGWSQRIGELGIDAEVDVVVYDDNGMKDAARIWWILRYWGVENARLLNGGWKGWQLAELRTTTEPPASTPPAEFTAKRRADRLATREDVLELLPENEQQIVDARSEAEFCGIDKRDNEKGGAIPGAAHLEWNHLIDQQTNRFKSSGELRRLFDQAGIDLSRPATSHCNGGGRASVMAFALELMGAANVRNYYRGWGEWGNSKETPVVVPTPPRKG